MVEPSLYNLKNQGKNKGKTRNFVVKTRVFGNRTGFFLKWTGFLKNGVVEKRRGFENPGFLIKGRGF